MSCRCKCFQGCRGMVARREDPQNERSEDILRAAWLLFALFLRRISSSGESRLKFLACLLARERGWEAMAGSRAWFYTIVTRRDCGKQRPTGVNYWREPLTREVTRKNALKMAHVLLFSSAFSALAFVLPRIVAASVSTFSGRIVVLARFTDCSSLFTSFNFAPIATRIQSRKSFNSFTPAFCPK